ncbi:unnamed protein product, partial [Prorocentrum cordatum]
RPEKAPGRRARARGARGGSLAPAMPRKKEKAKKAEVDGGQEKGDDVELLGGDDDAEGEGGELRISEKFAKKFNARKDKEELARAKRILAEEGDRSSHTSDSDAEDDEAERSAATRIMREGANHWCSFRRSRP